MPGWGPGLGWHKEPSKQMIIWGFPGGLMVKKPLCNARDTSSIPDPGRSHMPRSKWAHAPQLLSLCSKAQELELLRPMYPEPTLPNKRSHCNEKLVNWNQEEPLRAASRESLRAATKTQHNQNIKTNNNNYKTQRHGCTESATQVPSDVAIGNMILWNGEQL